MTDDSTRARRAPLTWLLASPHAGDNTQLRALAEGLGWPFTVKTLRYRRAEKALRFLRRATLQALEPAAAATLAPPWPDLVLLSGRPNEAVAFWIKARYPQAKLVFIGTPQWPLEAYDLVIATPQYALPERANVLQLSLPLHGLTAAALKAEGETWKPRLAHLPEPYVTVLVGGGSGPYVFTPEAGGRLAKEASGIAATEGGSLLVTTSPRTPAPVIDAITRNVSVPAYVHRWTPNDPDNPFKGFLALGNRIIVTADSISMIGEAIATGRRVELFDIEVGAFAMRAEEHKAVPPHWRGRTLEATAFRLLIRFAPPRFSRDLRIVHRAVTEQGLANWLGDPPREQAVAPENGLAQSLLRVRQLFGL